MANPQGCNQYKSCAAGSYRSARAHSSPRQHAELLLNRSARAERGVGRHYQGVGMSAASTRSKRLALVAARAGASREFRTMGRASAKQHRALDVLARSTYHAVKRVNRGY